MRKNSPFHVKKLGYAGYKTVSIRSIIWGEMHAELPNFVRGVCSFLWLRIPSNLLEFVSLLVVLVV